MKRPGVLWLTATIILIVVVTSLAYLRLLPTFLGEIPYLDKVLHFSIFGMLTLSVLAALGDRRLRVGGLSLPLAVLVPLAYATIEEALQGLSPYRHRDVWDLMCDAAGMLLAWLLAHRWAAARHAHRRGAPSVSEGTR